MKKGFDYSIIRSINYMEISGINITINGYVNGWDIRILSRLIIKQCIFFLISLEGY